MLYNEYASSFFYFWLGRVCAAWGILVPWPGIKPVPPAVEAWSANHWIIKELPASFCISEHLAWECQWASSHFLQRVIVLGASSFLREDCRSVQKLTHPCLWEESVFLTSLLSFILEFIKIKNKNKLVQQTTHLLLASANGSFLSGLSFESIMTVRITAKFLTEILTWVGLYSDICDLSYYL